MLRALFVPAGSLMALDIGRQGFGQALVLPDTQGMNLPGWRLHPLTGDLADHWAVWVCGNWRMTFRFEGVDAVLIDYRDYH